MKYLTYNVGQCRFGIRTKFIRIDKKRMHIFIIGYYGVRYRGSYSWTSRSNRFESHICVLNSHIFLSTKKIRKSGQRRDKCRCFSFNGTHNSLHYHLTTRRSYWLESSWKQIHLPRRCPDFLAFFGTDFSGCQSWPSFIFLSFFTLNLLLHLFPR